MGGARARRPPPDVSHRPGPQDSQRRWTAIYVRVALDDNSGSVRYMLETLLSTLGVPYRFAGEEGEVGAPDPCVHLVAGISHTASTGHLAPGVAVVPLPETDPGMAAVAESLVKPDADAPECRDARSRVSTGGAQSLLPELSRNPHYSARSTQHSALGRLFALLAREEERSTEARDEYGRFQWAHSSVRPAELAVRPLVSEYAHLLLGRLREACEQQGLPMVRKEFWPRGKAMAACLTHDVDAVRRGKLPRGVAVRDVTATLSALGRGRFRSAASGVAAIARTAASPQDPYWTFDRISALEREHGFRSTYFFMTGRHHPRDATYGLGETRIARLLASLAESGCEVALHGSYASHLDAESLRAQRACLESQLGQGVRGHRNHLLRFRVPDSWEAHEAAGLSYDSTLGFADREGFRGGHAFPFHPYDLAGEHAMGLLEIPLAIMDATLQKYRRLRGEEAKKALQAVLHQTLAVGGLATLLWHNDSFYEPDYPGCGGLYVSALSWLSEHDVHVATCGEIDRWWRAREAVSLSPLRDGRRGWRLESPMEIDGLVLRLSLPDATSSVRVGEPARAAVRRAGSDHLVEFGRLPAGFEVEIEVA